MSRSARDLLPAAIRSWLDNHAARAELRNLPADQRRIVLDELGLTEAAIGSLKTEAPGETRLEHRLEGVGLDAEGLRHAHPAVMRDLQVACSACGHYHRCEKDRGAADANERMEGYCSNTHTIAAFLSEGDE